MNLDSLTNRGEYLSAHYLAEMLPGELKRDLLKRWAVQEKDGEPTPRTRLRELRRTYLSFKAELLELDNESKRHDKLHELHSSILTALGFTPERREITVRRAAKEHAVAVAHAEPGILAIEADWVVDPDAEIDVTDRLLEPVSIDNTERIDSATKLASYLLLEEEQPPRYVLVLSGPEVVLADRLAWFEGRYLAVNLDVAFGRNDTGVGGEIDVIAALFGADSLRPPPEGGTELLATLRDGSRQHAVGVSAELREGLRLSVEHIAQEVLDRIRDAGVRPEQIMEPAELGKELAREALRYLYRILFLLYAEARPELGVLPVDHPEYATGYSLARLGEIASRKLVSESAGQGIHLHESLDLLFRMVNDGHRPRGAVTIDGLTSEREGIRFEPLKSDLFLPEKTRLIGRAAIVHPDHDEDDPAAPRIDTRLRNACLHRVLRLLMIAKGRKKERGGFISYAQLGINQLGAVYEGLMSYTGFIATEELYEVAKNGDPRDGSWMIPTSKVEEYTDEVFVWRTDDETGQRHKARYPTGSFVYRLAGRDRQTSASYYTPQSLTEVTVQLALQYRLEEESREVAARELLEWTICEPALGSGAFLNEAINQLAAEYLRRAQKERGETLDPERYAVELQKAKAYIALHNCYGVDLNRTAVELAEVSLWLNTMHPGLRAPWFGLHLRRGNSLIGAGRKTYTPQQLTDKSWLKAAPAEHMFRDGDLPKGVVHHFLLPADGWGAVATNKEAKELAPEDSKRLGDWRKALHKTPSTKGRRGKKLTQVQRLQALSGRVEYLWKLVLRRLEISEREIRRDIAVWGAGDLPPVPADAVFRDKIVKDLESTGTPYWRLKTIMDVWCALWFWPLDQVSKLDGTAPEYGSEAVVTRIVEEPVHELIYAEQSELDLGFYQQLTVPGTGRQTGTRSQKQTVTLRELTPLASLDDWLDFADAMLGRRDIPRDTLLAEFETLDEIEAFEDSLAPLMGMDDESRLADRFPWLTVATTIAEEQGFFHWELTFAHVFARGGFDLQVGNPPWVRSDWEAPVALAEYEPWFKLMDLKKVPEQEKERRRAALLRLPDVRRGYLAELVRHAGTAFYGAPSTYPLLEGTRPNLYRAFMCITWEHLAPHGIVGMLHQDSHFDGIAEKSLRASSYRHLRLHAGFVNVANWAFADAGRTLDFGLHIYGSGRSRIDFVHLSHLYGTEVLTASLTHDAHGDPPSQKYNRKWDVRPHGARAIRVSRELLAEWRGLSDDADLLPEEAPLPGIISTFEQGAIDALIAFPSRLGAHKRPESFGYREKDAKDRGLIAYQVGLPDSLDEVILQGTHLGIATPFAKAPNDPFTNGKDWVSWDLTALPENTVPRTTYTRVGRELVTRGAEDVWNGRRYTEYYRLAWRAMIDPKSTERSLFAALIPPGPAHIHTVHSLALETNRETALNAGFWASLPLDYLIRITGRSHLQVAAANAMPSPRQDHPLASPLLLRTLRLNCLTNAYARIWADVFDPGWTDESWVVSWEGLGLLGAIGSTWASQTPLRAEYARRAALVELDALVAVWVGVGLEELLAILRSRYSILTDREDQTWFDARGRRVAADPYAFGVGQVKADYEQLMNYFENPERNPVPNGYVAPFYKADRETEYRQAHAVFSRRLQDAIDAGWEPS
jgi:hypothetical protein